MQATSRTVECTVTSEESRAGAENVVHQRRGWIDERAQAARLAVFILVNVEGS